MLICTEQRGCWKIKIPFFDIVHAEYCHTKCASESVDKLNNTLCGSVILQQTADICDLQLIDWQIITDLGNEGQDEEIFSLISITFTSASSNSPRVAFYKLLKKERQPLSNLWGAKGIYWVPPFSFHSSCHWHKLGSQPAPSLNSPMFPAFIYLPPC